MGRLSDARKKAKGGATSGVAVQTGLEPSVPTAPMGEAAAPAPSRKQGGRAAGSVSPRDDASPLRDEAAAPVSFAAEGRKADPAPQLAAAQRLADDLLAGIDVEEAAPVAAPAPVAEPRFYDDEADDAATPSSSYDDMSLPSSGLAEDLLAEMERRAALRAAKEVPAKAADDFMLAWPSDNEVASKNKLSEDDRLQAQQLGDDVLALMGSEPPVTKKPRGIGTLPSSGLADDILRDMPAPAPKTPLGIDEVHEFESFFEEERAAEQLQLVLFQMGTELFALEIDRVQEIIRVPAITRVPHSLDAVRGVCNLRGRIVPVLDLRKLMRLLPKSIDRFNRIMVLDVAGKRIGVLIDRVSEVARINVTDVEPPPEELRAIDANLVTAVARLGERMIFILDVDRVLALK